MKRFVEILFGFVIASSICLAQANFENIRVLSTAPVGPCSEPVSITKVNGGLAPGLYQCLQGVWTLTAPSSSGTASGLAGGVLGSLPIQSAPSTTAMVAPNTSTTPRILVQTGTGTVGASPVWTTTLPATSEPAHTGDATNTAGSLAMTVVQVNGASVPASATVIGSNSSSQLIVTATTGTGSAVLSTSPTLTGPVAISGTTQGITFSAGTATAGASGNVVISSDATVGNLMVNENATGPSRACTALNGACASATQVNGASVPASASVLSSNSSSQITAATSHNESLPANCVQSNTSTTAYTCTTAPTFTPASGDHIQFEALYANTASSTLAVNGAAAATIKKWGGSGTLIANDLLASHWISATFDGTYWQLEGQLGNANTTQVNGATVPVSSAVLGSNASSQLITPSAVAHSVLGNTTGSAGAPSFTSAPSVTSITINSGTAMGGSTGTGGYAQETTSAAKTSGDLASYDANGNVVDSGVHSPVFGMVTLVSGTYTVSTTAACTPNGTTCNIQLTRCIGNGSPAVGALTVSTVVVGTSFIINSYSSVAAVVTGDIASVCWRIN